ncbi:MAG TPA: twin-arginine translocase TatA/TatE family subunit [Planctomycetaceae bacterium]|jgi:sec-independent protein translocase protein TatA|nr:twin-arginine translocase TatA/TatE family subunit [Planctomycetaceae bacterium]MCH2590875.1 twin-arginine translocase TatA/TatE family subunit [Planctomycetales bacterium]HAA59523.1 twin-arginine translocase TatA/TatE family subunit [Planctomycetaceae bacterium]|tara:strand:- start:2438 stop:2617 length:180 start_codon:yes stop_codon:yes gene_type:complete
MFTPGIWQMLIVLVIILLFFGGKRIPTMMRSIGQSVTEFKKGINDADDPEDGAPPPEDV